MINLFQRNSDIKSKQGPFIQNTLKILVQLDSIIVTLLQYVNNQDIEFTMVNILNLVFTSLVLIRESNIALNENAVNIISIYLIIVNKFKPILFILDSLIYNIFKYFQSKENNSAQAIIIYIINLYAKMFANSEKNLLILDKEQYIIKHIVNKFSHTSNDQEILSIICFMTTLVEQYQYKISEYIYQARVIESFNLIPNFTNSLNIVEYTDGERNVNHIIFCWTIFFLRQSLIPYEFDLLKSNYYEVVLNYLITHEQRITKLFESVDFTDLNGNIIPKSLAYLEELEYVSGLMGMLWSKFKYWKKVQKYVDFYNKLNLIIISRTILLFDVKKQKEQYFKTHSTAERSMKEIICDKNTEFLLSSNKKPEKKENIGLFSPNKKSKDFNEDKANDLLGGNKTSLYPNTTNFSNFNAMNIYWFKIELTLSRILMNITDCLKYARVYDYYNNNIFYINNMKSIYKPNQDVLVAHCNNLLDSLTFATNALDNLVKNNNLKLLYDKCMIYYHNIISIFH